MIPVELYYKLCYDLRCLKEKICLQNSEPLMRRIDDMLFLHLRAYFRKAFFGNKKPLGGIVCCVI